MLKKVITAELRKEDIVTEATLTDKKIEPKAEKKDAAKAKEEKKESTDDSKVESKSTH